MNKLATSGESYLVSDVCYQGHYARRCTHWKCSQGNEITRQQYSEREECPTVQMEEHRNTAPTPAPNQVDLAGQRKAMVIEDKSCEGLKLSVALPLMCLYLVLQAATAQQLSIQLSP